MIPYPAAKNADAYQLHVNYKARGIIRMRCQTYEITFVGQAGTTLCAEFDDCAITIS